MGISVKNARVEAEIRLLADKMGVSLTEAIEAGVQAKLAELAAARAADIQRRKAAIQAIQERVAARIKPGTTSDHSDLYDEFGLPV